MAEVCMPDCFHCGLSVSTGEQFCEQINGVRRLFCCPACRVICRTIIDNGMDAFYQYRTRADSAPSLETLKDCFAAFDTQQFQQRFVSFQPCNNYPCGNGHSDSEQNGNDQYNNVPAKATVQLLIGGIHCAACVWLLENYLQRMPGVERVSVNLSEHKATLVWHTQHTSLSALCRAIAQLGYQPEPYSSGQLQDLQRRENHQAQKRLGVAGIAMMQVGMFAIALYAGGMQSIALEYRDLMRWVSLLVTTPVVFYSASPFFTGAWRGLMMRRPGMDVPVAIAIALAYLASCRATINGSGDVYFDSVTMFTFLLLAGRYLEMRARYFSGRLNTNDINSLLPATAIKLVGDKKEQQQLPLFNITKGDIVLVKPGQLIPADGQVIEGRSGVNESQLTGEFKLQQKNSGDQVVAGTLNGEGSLTIRVQATGAQLQLQAINTLLGQAQSDKPIIAQWADCIAGYFVVAVLLLALCTYVFWLWHDADSAFWVMLSVLVVSCPCALSLATPAALAAATSRLRQCGLLVTASHVWQTIPHITHVVCDKTGTLTEGRLTVSAVHCFSSLTSSQCLDIAAALEAHSEHPIASAFSQRKTQPMSAQRVHIAVGKGIEGTIDGLTFRIGTSEYASALYAQAHTMQPPSDSGQWIFLSDQQGPLCGFELTDTVRDSAKPMIEALRQQGLSVHMLSGDSSPCARQLSEQLGLQHCIDGASPQDKLDYIHRLQQEGARVLMLGDGINDIPVLCAADVSVAMCHASNLAKTHADCILLGTNLRAVIFLLQLAAKTRRTIQQNLAWALAYNLSAIPLAAMALLAPYVAAAGMSLSSLVVVGNALRLQRFNSQQQALNNCNADPLISPEQYRAGQVR